MDIALFASILTITIRAGTSLMYATVGEILTERSGILNLGVEGMMIMGAVSAFAAAFHTGSAWAGVCRRDRGRGAAGADPRHLDHNPARRPDGLGLALTIFGTGLSSFLGQRLGPAGQPLVGQVGPRFDKFDLPVLALDPLLGQRSSARTSWCT